MKKVFVVVLMGVLVFIGFCFGFLTPVSAQDFPKKNIRWFVGYSPGGGFDTYSRALARTMEKYLPKGLHVIVVNRPGSASQMFFEPKYDVKKVTWLGTVLVEPMVLAASSKSDFRTVKDLQGAKSVRLALTGFTGPEIAAPITMEKLGVKAQYITGHTGSGQAMLAAMRGDADAVVFSYGSLRKLLLDKSFVPLLLMGEGKRNPEIPDCPTATEAGYPELDDLVAAWRVIGGTPGIPEDQKKKLRELIWKSINDPEFLEWSKKSKRPVSPLDGIATERALAKILVQYDGLRDILEKYMK